MNPSKFIQCRSNGEQENGSWLDVHIYNQSTHAVKLQSLSSENYDKRCGVLFEGAILRPALNIDIEGSVKWIKKDRNFWGAYAANASDSRFGHFPCEKYWHGAGRAASAWMDSLRLIPLGMFDNGRGWNKLFVSEEMVKAIKRSAMQAL